MSLRSRITLGYVLLVVSSFSLIIHLIMKDVRPRYLEAVEESTVETAELLAAVISQQFIDNAFEIKNIEQAMSTISKRSLHAKIYEIEKQKVNLTIYITDKNGILLYDSSNGAKPGMDFSKWNDIYLTLQGKYGARSTRTIADDPTSSTLYVAAPIKKNGELIGVVSVGKPKNSVSFFVEIAKKKFLLAMVLVGMSAIGLAIALSSWITQPIRKLIEYVHSIQQGKSSRLPHLGSSEIGTLGTALEKMRAKLEGKSYIENYISTFTHEMKSPLTAIRGASEILRDDVPKETRLKFINNIDSEAARLQNLVERMLQLSRIENIESISKNQLDLRKIIEEAIESLQVQLKKKQMTIKVDLKSSGGLEGDSFLFRQAIVNLISNSIDFSPEQSKIEIITSNNFGKLNVLLRDYGSGIPDFAVTKVFDKFFSLDRPGTGKKSTGLGLPFVKEVVSLHGGEIFLENMHPGLKIEMNFPV